MSDRNLKKLHITDNEFDNIYKLNVSDLDFSFLIEYLPSNLQKNIIIFPICHIKMYHLQDIFCY